MVNRDSFVLVSFLVGLFLIGAFAAYAVSLAGSQVGFVTGNSIRDSVHNFYETSSVGQRVAIFSMVVLSFVVIFIAVLLVTSRFKKRIVISKKRYEVEGGSRSKTDLDTLYAILKDKEVVGMEDIEATFKIDGDIALGWSKILEDGDLAEIEYPRFGKPVLRLLEEKEKKEDKKNLDSEEENGTQAARQTHELRSAGAINMDSKMGKNEGNKNKNNPRKGAEGRGHGRNNKDNPREKSKKKTGFIKGRVKTRKVKNKKIVSKKEVVKKIARKKVKR